MHPSEQGKNPDLTSTKKKGKRQPCSAQLDLTTVTMAETKHRHTQRKGPERKQGGFLVYALEGHLDFQ